jgi:hypothetical protein
MRSTGIGGVRPLGTCLPPILPDENPDQEDNQGQHAAPSKPLGTWPVVQVERGEKQFGQQSKEFHAETLRQDREATALNFFCSVASVSCLLQN